MTETTGATVEDTTEAEAPVEPAPVDPPADKDTKTAYTPPTESEWRAAQDKLKKANAQAAAHRKAADEAARKGESESEAKIREVREEAARESEARYKPKLVAKAIEGAASKAGFTGSTEYLVRLLGGPEAIELDDDLEVVDLDDRIKDLKRDLSGLFTKTAATRIDGADRPGQPARSTDESRRLKMLKEAGLA